MSTKLLLYISRDIIQCSPIFALLFSYSALELQVCSLGLLFFSHLGSRRIIHLFNEYAMHEGARTRIGRHHFDVVWYDTIEGFNVDSKAQCDQLNLAHVAAKKYFKKYKIKNKLKQTNASALRYRFKICEGSQTSFVRLWFHVECLAWVKIWLVMYENLT